MNTNEKYKLETFQRSVVFCENNAADFAATGGAAAHVANLRRIIGEIERVRVEQKITDSAAKDAIYESLRQEIRNVFRTASAIAQDEPGFASEFALPESFSHRSVLTTADKFLKALERPDVMAKFAEKDFPADYRERFAANRDIFAARLSALEHHRLESMQSVAEIRRLIRSGMKELRYLDAILRHKYSSVPEKLDVWMSLRRVPGSRRKEDAAVPEGQASTAEAAVT
jgi:hypothetical protein